jgi:Flp pilus assembly protein TadD
MQRKDALPALERAAQLLPNDVEAHNNLGTAWRRLGRLEDAMGSYRRALAIEPDIAEVHNNLGNALKDLGRLEDAVASYRRAAKSGATSKVSVNISGAALRT